MNEAEAREFWQTHEITDEFLSTAPPISDDEPMPVETERRPGRPQLPATLMWRLKRLAWERRISVDMLLGEIVEQGLAAEEARQAHTARRSG